MDRLKQTGTAGGGTGAAERALATMEQALRKFVETRTDNFPADLARSLSKLADLFKADML
jgi:hypothetical protein